MLGNTIRLSKCFITYTIKYLLEFMKGISYYVHCLKRSYGENVCIKISIAYSCNSGLSIYSMVVHLLEEKNEIADR